MRFLFILVVSFMIFFSSFKLALADSSKFSVSQDITYNVNEQGGAKVTKNIHIKNLTTESLAKEFVVKLKDTEITNIKAFDASGQLPITQFKTKDGYEIRVQFGKLAPGIDKTLHWTMSYDVTGIASKVGRLWKVIIPKTPTTSNTDDLSVGLYVPQSFGTPLLAKPLPTTNNNIWTGKAASQEIISLFGPISARPYQAYSFKLNYNIENKELIDKEEEIVLPPNTNYQQVLFDQISPKPNSTKIDPDGNFIASYLLPPRKKLNIVASGDIAVFGKPQKSNTVEDNLNTYLIPDKYWESNSTEIKSIASKLNSPEEIYNFTVSYLSYDKNKSINDSKRLGATGVLKARLSAICTEFTDLFIALARSKNIPSREIDGFAYTEDQNIYPGSHQIDILHAWPEYYDLQNKTWYMVDPTWGKTSGGTDYFHTFDFDHVALAIKGLDSESPKPAGFYKKTNKLKKFINSAPPSKDVFIKPVDKDLILDPSPILTLSVPSNLVVLEKLPSKSEISVTNSSKTTSNRETLTIGSNKTISLTVPALSTSTLEIPIDLSSLTRENSLIYTLNGEEKTQNVKIIPFLSLEWLTSLPGYFL